MAIPERDPFAALGDANRRIILADLAGGESSVQELADRMTISRPAVSRHLRLLKEAGLVSDRADGVRRIYRIDETGAAEIRRFMEDVWGEAVARFRIVVENTASE
jgi:DNA-binding transcriptional ArsR family regulator